MKLTYFPSPFINDNKWHARIVVKSPSGKLQMVRYNSTPYKFLFQAMKSSFVMAWEHTLIKSYGFKYIDECPKDKEVEFALLEYVESNYEPKIVKGVLRVIEDTMFIDVEGFRWHLGIFPLVLFKEIV